jgi:hypothetical protein
MRTVIPAQALNLTGAVWQPPDIEVQAVVSPTPRVAECW